MLTIGLTGGYATGKSTVAAILRELGAAVVSADELSHAAIARGEPAWQEIKAAFGDGILSASGEIDRARLGGIVFADPEARLRLEAIVHPRVIKAIEASRARAAADGAKAFVCEAPLLFEADLARAFDSIWVVTASPARQEAMAASRDRLAPDAIKARQAAQLPLAEKERRADVVIGNDGDRAALRRQVLAAWQRLKI